MRDTTDPNMKIDDQNVLVEYSGQDEVAVIPEGVEEIGMNAFKNNETIREAILPKSLIEIACFAFAGASLEKIKIPEGVKKIGIRAFRDCRKLREVILPDNLESIESEAFEGCAELETLRLPSGLKKMGREILGGCGIRTLSVPNGLVYVGEDVFSRMCCLEKIDFPASLRTIGQGAFSFCGELKEVCIPEGTVRIEKDAFQDCRSLEKTMFPKSLVFIGPGAFAGTKMENTAELQEICRRLDSVKIYTKPIGCKELAFGGMRLFCGFGRTFRGDRAPGFRRDTITRDHDIADGQSVVKMQDGRKALMIREAVPTFDSGDREWDSYRELILIPCWGGMTGVMVCGGYQIARIVVYNRVLWADERTERLLKSTGIFR